MTARIKEILAAMEKNGGAYVTTAEIAEVQVLAFQVQATK